MDTVTGETSPESGSEQPSSQPTRLCQACLSVLARDNLEVERDYPHHSTLRAFVEASNTKCYVCSWLLSQVWEDYRNTLGQLAEGITPHYMIVEEGETTDTGASDLRAELIYQLRKVNAFQKVNETSGESVSWVSFTTMRIEAPASYESCCKISAYLNPSYEGYFPLDREIYNRLLRDYWLRLAINSVWTNKLIITSYEGESILTLTITRWN